LDPHRTDLRLLEIFQLFNEQLMSREVFHLYGHSGGGQFVNRFLSLYARYVDEVALSAPGSHAFPRRDIDYPYGLKLDDLESVFGPQIKAQDLELTGPELDDRLVALLNKRVFILVGDLDTVPGTPETAWQGSNRYDKAINYLPAMQGEHERQIQAGLRPAHDPYRFELHIMPGVGHDSGASAVLARQLLFPLQGDVDSDEDVDLDDVDAFVQCFAGPGTAVAVECRPANLDWDSVLDLDPADFPAMQQAFGAD
jgi:hypothetical protein